VILFLCAVLRFYLIFLNITNKIIIVLEGNEKTKVKKQMINKPLNKLYNVF
jgi:hypothetical protein